MIPIVFFKRCVRPALLLGPLGVAIALFAAAAPAVAFDGSDRVSFGSGVTVRQGEEVSGDLVVFGGDAVVNGKVDGDAVVMGGDLTIGPTGEVDGSTIAFGGAVTNNSDQPGSGHHKRPGVVPPVVPIITPFPMETPEQTYVDHGGPRPGWIGFLVVVGILTLLAFAIVPGPVRTVRDELVQRPILGSAIGFCWPFIFVAIIIALAITVIGIVLMPAAVVAVVAAYLVGRAAVALLLGRRLFEVANVVEPAPLATAALGVLIITVVEALVPLWLGIVIEACVGAVAIGAAMLPFLHQRHLVPAAPAGYMVPPQPVFTPPTPPPPSGPPAVPQ